MSKSEGVGTEQKKSSAGRNPVATEDQARQAIEDFRRRGGAITTAGIKGVIGGAAETVERLLEKIGALPDRIDVTSHLPIALSKIFQQCVQGWRGGELRRSRPDSKPQDARRLGAHIHMEHSGHLN